VCRGAAARLVQRGFSLLELLVTLFVVVLITSLVTLNVGSGSGDIRLDAKVRNLADVAGYALDEAQMLGLDYGLLLQRVDVDGEMLYTYSWRERRPEGWQLPTSGKDLFAEQQMPPEIELHLELENVPVAELSLGGGEVEAPPQVVLYASGETTPGAIEVRRRDNSELLWRVEWDLLGRFELLRRGEVEEAL
jgi:general secretion pathway protein H